MNKLAAVSVFFALVSACACAEASMDAASPRDNETGGGGGASPDGGSGGLVCLTIADCPTAYTCDNGTCVPPEVEKDRSVSSRPPVASPHYVYALNPAANAVARIDPTNLAIESIAVGSLPVDLTALPGEDAAVALSYLESSLSLIDSTTTPSKLIRVPLKRQYGRLAVSQDGKWAIAYPDPTQPPATGAEGVVTLVDLAGARAKKPIEQIRFERATGFRVTDVVFHTESGKATVAYVFSKTNIALIDVRDPAANPLPPRVDLPATMSTDVRSREVIADKEGKTVLLRSTVSPDLAYFDGTKLRSVPLAEIATDLDLSPDGTYAVAALRAAKKVAYIELPQDLIDPTGIELFDAAGLPVGQVALPPVQRVNDNYVFVYTNATEDEAFARIDLPSGKVTRYTLQKLVDEIAISPDGQSALVIHRPNTTSSASDDYERAVDADQGYTIFDVDTGYAQLKRTGKVEPGPYAFSPVGGYAGVALRDDVAGKFALDAVNLRTLVASTLPLASAPEFMGPVPLAQGMSQHRVFVSQKHQAGRISVVNLDDGQIRTATGFTLNSEIE